MYAVGIMSGTSLDGVDVALVEITDVSKVKLCYFETFDYDNKLLEKIKLCVNNESVKVDFISGLNVELGQFYGDCVLKLCMKNNFDVHKLSFIASHGQTIAHCPKSNGYYNNSTFQLGEASEIARICECDVISDFRVMDIALGGEGAPLVPISEYYLYSETNKNILLQNIGGIGNVTVLTSNKDDIFAFDTGPGNMMINYAMQVLYGKSYDNNGEVASKGKIITDLKEELINHPYLRQSPPKSAGREQFGDSYTQELISKYCDNKSEDLIYTFTWYSAYCIYKSYFDFIINKGIKIDKVIIGGGGAHNLVLMQCIKELLKDYKVYTQEELGFSSDAKEAIAFALLGYLFINDIAGNIISVTGASKEAILGKLTKWKKD